jgi:tRNA threonylcarbamoyladenosine biosynthesis protein TsaB
MVILSFDTTSMHGGAVLARDEAIVAELRAGGSANYSVQLFEMANSLLADAGLTLGAVGLFAVASGPGSFTGIRVGLAAAQGWARALGRAVRAVPVFEAMLAEANPTAGVALTLLDARRSEFYVAAFRSTVRDPAHVSRPFLWIASGDGVVLEPSCIAALADDLRPQDAGRLTFIVREDDAAARDLGARVCRQLQPVALTVVVPSFLPPAIARVAWQAAGDGRLQQPEELDACYIRRSDAELNWRE